jgi:predicted permease
VTAILDVLTKNILPIFLVAGAGFWRPVASVVFNVFSPALVFSSLVSTQLPVTELGRLALFTLLTVLSMGALGLLVGRSMQLCKVDMAVLLLGLMFVNGGNYGLTLNQLRYGEQGLSLAIVYYIVSTILAYTVGVLIVSLGHRSLRESLQKLTGVPAIYAVVLALVVYGIDAPIPGPLMTAVDLAAGAAIPAMIVVLGMNMADMARVSQLRLALPVVSMRLLIGPLVGLTIAAVIGLEGLGRSVSVIEASMPSAVLTTVLATEFETKPATMTGIVVLSTLASPITLSLLINFLKL